jgi:hypothetical protein
VSAKPTPGAPLTLDALYHVPEPLASLEEFERFYARDLPRRARAELLRERERLKLRLLLDDFPDPWLFQRLDALRRVLGDAR